MKVEITGKSSGSFCISSELFEAGGRIGLGRRDWVVRLRSFCPRYVAIDISIRLGEGRKGVQGGFGKLLPPQIVDASGHESRVDFVADASRGCGPIDKGGVAKLLRESGGARRLEGTEYGTNREALSFGEVAIGVGVRGALARGAGADVGGEERNRGSTLAVSREFGSVEACENFGRIVIGDGC